MSTSSEADEQAPRDPQPISLEDLACDVQRRREALGQVDMPRNAGKRRTASKRALLKAIEEAGGKW